MRIGAVVPVYNRERFIGPYLDMLIDFGVTPLVTLGTKPWASQGNDETEVQDRTELILSKFFPGVEVRKDHYAHQKDSFNRGLEKLEEYDLRLVQDCDIFLTRKDWEDFLVFVKDNPLADAYSANFHTMFYEYYYDYRYGKAALPGGDPPIVAVKKNTQMVHMTQASTPYEAVWDINEIKFHHFRFCKPSGSGKKRCVEPVDKKDYVQAPEEIVERLKKWETILTTL